MNNLRIPPYASILLVPLLLAACQEGMSPPAAVTSSAPQAQTDATATGVKQPTTIVIGTYVDPSTMMIGGSNTLSSSDRLFAGIAFQPTAGGTLVVAKVLDAGGTELVRKEATVSDVGQTSINFDLGSPGESGLKPGDYTISIEVPGQPAASAALIVR